MNFNLKGIFLGILTVFLTASLPAEAHDMHPFEHSFVCDDSSAYSDILHEQICSSGMRSLSELADAFSFLTGLKIDYNRIIPNPSPRNYGPEDEILWRLGDLINLTDFEVLHRGTIYQDSGDEAFGSLQYWDFSLNEQMKTIVFNNLMDGDDYSDVLIVYNEFGQGINYLDVGWNWNGYTRYSLDNDILVVKSYWYDGSPVSVTRYTTTEDCWAMSFREIYDAPHDNLEDNVLLQTTNYVSGEHINKFKDGTSSIQFLDLNTEPRCLESENH